MSVDSKKNTINNDINKLVKESNDLIKELNNKYNFNSNKKNNLIQIKQSQLEVKIKQINEEIKKERELENKIIKNFSDEQLMQWEKSKVIKANKYAKELGINILFVDIDKNGNLKYKLNKK